MLHGFAFLYALQNLAVFQKNLPQAAMWMSLQ